MNALTVFRIRAVKGIPEFIGKIREDLEADGSQHQKNDGKGVDTVVGGREENTHRNARKGQGKRP